jgi:Domain of unknown function (DUF4234)
MSEAAASTPPAATTKPLGNQRGVGITIVLGIVTIGIYVIVWQWKTFNEIKNYRGQGVGGFAGFLLSFVAVSIFLLPSYVGKLYQEDSQRAPITGWSGFWVFFPYVGTFVWLAKVQGALNDFWVSKGQPRK